jgi:lysophospholipase L1-like esterase
MDPGDLATVERGRHWARYLDGAVEPPGLPRAAPSNGLRLLALGDCWFSHFPAYDVLVALRRNHGYAIDSVAVAGAQLTEMTAPPSWDPARPPDWTPAGHGRQVADLLKRMKSLSPAQRQSVRAVLISGGANDVVADRTTFAALLNPAGPGVAPLDESALQRKVDVELRQVLGQVLAAVTELCRLHLGRVVPILIHGYAHPVPDGRGGALGAWLQPVLRERGYTELKAGTEIMARLVDRFNVMQMQLLAANAVALAHVTHVDLRPTLSNALAGDAYRASWQNELTPTIAAGFTAVADRLEQALQVLQPR